MGPILGLHMLERTVTLAIVIAAAFTVPSVASGQGLGFGARVGTLGLGGELAIAPTERIVLRGGVGVVPFDPTTTYSDVNVSVSVPTAWNVGVDLYLNQAFRIGGGMLFRSSDPTVTGELDGPQEIGGVTYTPQEIGTLSGVFDANDRAPYVLIGFGPHVAPGVGLFVDLGVAFMGDTDVRLDVSGGTLDPLTDAVLRDALDQEAAEFEDEVQGYLKFWPILSLGVRLGVR